MSIEISLWLVDANEYRTLIDDLDELYLTDLDEIKQAVTNESSRLDQALAREYVRFLSSWCNGDEEEGHASDYVAVEFLIHEVGRRGKQSWYLGYLQSLAEGKLNEAANAVALLEPVRRFLDESVPDMLYPYSGGINDAWGIWGAWSPEALKQCLPAVERFETPADVEDFIRSLDQAAVCGGSETRAAKRATDGVAEALRAWMGDKYQWEMWQNIRAAVRTAVSSDGCLVVYRH